LDDQNRRLIKVVWVDARTDNGWVKVEDAQLAINETYGALLTVEARVVKIAGTAGLSGDVADITTIPLANIVEWYELVPKRTKAPKSRGGKK
jgi:hypothetical protein